MPITMVSMLNANLTRRLSIEIPFELSDNAANVKRAYTMLLRELKEDTLYIYRVWNFLPHIEVEGVYEGFNKGRAEAFSSWYHCDIQEIFPFSIPVATCVGSDSDSIRIEAIIGPKRPNVIFNPYQKEPCLYSKKFGQVPPLFSRAAVTDGKMYIAGTASIFGEDSVNNGSIANQLSEIVRNISELISRRNTVCGDVRQLRDFIFTVYIDPVYDTPSNREKIRTELGVFNVNIKPAKMCRPELIVEVEATEIQ